MTERTDAERAELLAKEIMEWHKGIVYTGYGGYEVWKDATEQLAIERFQSADTTSGIFRVWKDATEQLAIEPYDWHPEINIEQAMRVVDAIKQMPLPRKLVFIEALEKQASGTVSSWWFMFIADRPRAICLAAEKVAEMEESK